MRWPVGTVSCSAGMDWSVIPPVLAEAGKSVIGGVAESNIDGAGQ